MNDMRVLVCGGRDFADRDLLNRTLCAIDEERGPINCVIHGGARGADLMAMEWAQMMSKKYYPRRPVFHRPFPAKWRLHGKAAGPLRNQEMLDVGQPDMVVAFPGGTGTADMVARTKTYGIRLIEVAEDGTRTENGE